MSPELRRHHIVRTYHRPVRETEERRVEQATRKIIIRRRTGRAMDVLCFKHPDGWTLYIPGQKAWREASSIGPSPQLKSTN